MRRISALRLTSLDSILFKDDGMWLFAILGFIFGIYCLFIENKFMSENIPNLNQSGGQIITGTRAPTEFSLLGNLNIAWWRDWSRELKMGSWCTGLHRKRGTRECIWEGFCFGSCPRTLSFLIIVESGIRKSNFMPPGCSSPGSISHDRLPLLCLSKPRALPQLQRFSYSNY